MRRILVVALLAVAVSAQAAVVWKVTKPSDCTAAATPTICCVSAAPAVNPACLNRQSGGSLFIVRFDVAGDGGTYTGGGDALNAANFGLLGLNTVQWVVCNGASGLQPVALADATGKTVRVKLYAAGAGTEYSGTVATTTQFVCTAYGT